MKVGQILSKLARKNFFNDFIMHVLMLCTRFELISIKFGFVMNFKMCFECHAVIYSTIVLLSSLVALWEACTCSEMFNLIKIIIFIFAQKFDNLLE